MNTGITKYIQNLIVQEVQDLTLSYAETLSSFVKIKYSYFLHLAPYACTNLTYKCSIHCCYCSISIDHSIAALVCWGHPTSSVSSDVWQF